MLNSHPNRQTGKGFVSGVCWKSAPEGATHVYWCDDAREETEFYKYCEGIWYQYIRWSKCWLEDTTICGNMDEYCIRRHDPRRWHVVSREHDLRESHIGKSGFNWYFTSLATTHVDTYFCRTYCYMNNNLYEICGENMHMIELHVAQHINLISRKDDLE